MADLDTTLEPAAAVEETAQPAETQAVETTETSAATTETGQPATTEAAQPEPPTRLWAGKYKTPEELERGYAESTSEALRLYQENQRTGKAAQADPTTAAEPTYTEPQLRQFRDHWTRTQAEALASGDTQKAAEAFGKINECNDRLMDVRLSTRETQAQSRTAAQSLAQESAEMLKPHAEQLKPGTALFDAANVEYDKAVRAFSALLPPGTPLSPELNSYLSAVAVTMAAARTGNGTQKAAQAARSDLASTLQTTMKKAIQVGGGSAGKTDTTPDFDSMTPGDFAKYQKSQGLPVTV